MNGDPADLRSQAEKFAGDITNTVRSVAGEAVDPFEVVGSVKRRGTTRLTVSQAEVRGISLSIEAAPMLLLAAKFHCVWDHAQTFLAVDSSAFTVTAIAGSAEPLFRYDYVRSPTGGTPGAHVQVHAHRDALTYVMARCGDQSKRGKARVREVEQGDRVPQMSDLHFPVGGHRYRPCLEDVLEMLLDEFGVDQLDGARAALRAGRAAWRLGQLGAAVRDSPEAAAETLRVLGYAVTPPIDGPRPDRWDRLTAY